MKRGMEPFLVLNRTISSKSVKNHTNLWKWASDDPFKRGIGFPIHVPYRHN